MSRGGGCLTERFVYELHKWDENDFAGARGLSGEAPVIGTHHMNFHADEVTACALLKTCLPKFKDSVVVRTRDAAVLEACDCVLDVGGAYDPATHRYDHHQRDFEGYWNVARHNTKLSSCGLVWKHFGAEIIREYIIPKLALTKHTDSGITLTESERASDSQSELLVDFLYEGLYVLAVEAIDAADNGERVCKDEKKPQIPGRGLPGYGGLIASFASALDPLKGSQLQNPSQWLKAFDFSVEFFVPLLVSTAADLLRLADAFNKDAPEKRNENEADSVREVCLPERFFAMRFVIRELMRLSGCPADAGLVFEARDDCGNTKRIKFEFEPASTASAEAEGSAGAEASASIGESAPITAPASTPVEASVPLEGGASGAASESVKNLSRATAKAIYQLLSDFNCARRLTPNGKKPRV